MDTSVPYLETPKSGCLECFHFISALLRFRVSRLPSVCHCLVQKRVLLLPSTLLVFLIVLATSAMFENQVAFCTVIFLSSLLLSCILCPRYLPENVGAYRTALLRQISVSSRTYPAQKCHCTAYTDPSAYLPTPLTTR